MKKLVSLHINRQSLYAFFGVSAMTFLAKMAIVGRELVIAARYGRRDEVDAFLIAFLVPSFIVAILSNAMTTAVIPVYIAVREKEGKAAAQNLVAGISFLTLVTALAIAALVFVAAPLFLPLIASGFSEPKLALTRHLLLWVTPYIVFYGVLSFWYAIINAQEQFAGVVLPPVITPLVMVVLLWVLPSAGIYALVYGAVGGSALELLVAGGVLRAGGISLRPRWRGFSPSLQRVAGQFIPATMGALLMSSTLIVDQAMAATLAPGSVAAISYGNKVIGFLLTVLSTTFTILLTPYFSKKMVEGGGAKGGGRAAGEGEVSGVVARGALRSLWRFMVMIFVIAAVLPVLINEFSVPLVKLIFYRGAFSLTDVQMIAGVQALLAWQIPFYICGVILVKFIAALQLNWIQAVVAGCNVVVNVVMNYWLMQRMGVNGIALSTSIVHMVSLLLLVVLVGWSVKKTG